MPQNKCLLSHNELLELLDKGILENSDSELVNSASIDIRLGSKLLIEPDVDTMEDYQWTSLKRKEALVWKEWDLFEDGSYFLYPGNFILASSFEVFNLPNNISAEYKLKSSMARIGLDHLNAGWCDAGWHGSVLTLELKNTSSNIVIELHAGDKIGQMIFFRHEEVPADKSYAVRGRYNLNTEVSGARPDPMKAITFGEEDDDEAYESISVEPTTPKEDDLYDEANTERGWSNRGEEL